MADDVSVKLGLNAHDAKKELTDVEKLFNSFGSKIGKGLTSLSAGFAGFFAVGKIKDAIVSSIHYGSTIQDLSERFDVSTGAIQRYKLAAEQSGTSLEVFSKAFQKLNLNRDKALTGDQGAQQKFKDAGISLDQLKTQTPEQTFDAIARSGKGAAVEVALLGKNAQELDPLFRAIADGTAKLNNFVISPENVKRLDDLEDLFLALSQGALSLSATVIGTLIPAFEKFFTLVGEGQRIAAIPFEAITRRLGGAQTAGVPQGEAAADAGDTDLAAILKRHREEAGLAAVPDTSTPPGKEPLKKKEIHEKEKSDKEKAKDKKKFEREAKKELDDAEKAVLDEIKHGQGGEDEQKRDKQVAVAQEKLRKKAFDRANEEEVRNPGSLTLEEAAQKGSGAVGAKAQEALREEAQAKQLALQGNKELAQQHRSRAEQLKKELGLKAPKDEFRDALNEAEVLKKIEKNTSGAQANK